jgi:predicted PolB exonuclease-like 3'-5' exonuclease
MSIADVRTSNGPDTSAPAYLVFDTETVPDGKLLAMVKYADQHLTPEDAIRQAQAEARAQSRDQSDFVPVSFQYPIAICVLRVGGDYRIQGLTCLDAPQYRPREIVRLFWKGVAHYHSAKLVSYNGRGFDLPLLELAAFRYGYAPESHFRNGRHRYNGHIDLCDWISNYGACRIAGGLNLLSKLLGKPGKMEVTGDNVYPMYCAGQIQDINDYCMFDTLDTYFVFLRSRVVVGALALAREQELVAESKQWILDKLSAQPALSKYLSNWGDWDPWP